MRLGQIAERVGWAIDADSDYSRLDILCDLKSVIATAIAERALPATREWLDKFPESVSHNNGPRTRFVGDGFTLDIRHCDGRVEMSGPIPNVKTIGQLLDLLSGLGVRK